MQFPDSAFAALRIATDPADESAGWGRLLWLAIVLTIAAVSAGLLAGGLESLSASAEAKQDEAVWGG